MSSLPTTVMADFNNNEQIMSVAPADFLLSTDNESITTSQERIDTAIDSKKPAFLFFYADWCHFCQEQKPIIDKLEKTYAEDITFLRIDGQEELQLSKDFSITGFPSMFLLAPEDGGEYIRQEFIGFTDDDVLSQSIDCVLTTGVFFDKARVSSVAYTASESVCDGIDAVNSQVDLAPAPLCGNGEMEAEEECDDGNLVDGDGCSIDCQEESIQVYLAPYVGDIDGNIDEDWYFFYEELRQWHDDNSMPVGMSFYPGTMNDVRFNQIIADMYDSEYIELIIKGESVANGTALQDISYSDIRTLIEKWQNKFVSELENLGYRNVQVPVTYNQQLGEFTEIIRDAIYALSFKIYFEQFVGEQGYVDSLEDLDVMQYCIPFAVSGRAGANQTYKEPDEVIEEILDFEHDRILRINGIKVVSLMVHQQDFRLSDTSSEIDQQKLNAYTEVLQTAKDDVRIKLINPKEIYTLRHPLLCGNGILELGEECDDGDNSDGDGCSAICKQEKIVLLAMDDIQSNYLDEVQETVIQSHIKNNIPLTLGVIPGQIKEPLLTKIKNWDEDLLIEIAQHDYMHNMVLKGEDYEFQHYYLKRGTDLFNSWGIYPQSFVPAAGQVDEITIKVAKDLGFHTVYEGIYLDLSSPGDPFTLTNQLHLCGNNSMGVDCEFKNYAQIKSEAEQKIQEAGVALIMYHMQDFAEADSSLNIGKMDELVNLAYSFTKDDFTLMTVEQYYQYKNGGNPIRICQYAETAEAESEEPDCIAKYATGEPNSDNICSTQPIIGSSWEKESWDTPDTITLTFETPVYPVGLTIFGDYELCLSRVWLWRENAWYLSWEGVADTDIGDECTTTFDLSSMNFPTNKVRLQTCGWRWSAIDAVQLCGMTKSFPQITLVKPVQDEVIYGTKGNVAIEITTDTEAHCQFSYNKDFVFGEGISLSTLNGMKHSYDFIKPVSTESVNIYYKCKDTNGRVNPYSIMHRFNFRETNVPFIEICDWYDCAEGAASVSIDDGYHTTIDEVKATCREKLEANGLKGTYYLAYADLYTEADWDIWRDAYAYGHEIGGHMGNCSYERTKEHYTSDLQNNIKDLVQNIGMSRSDLISFAWPCGEETKEYQEWIRDYYLFQRGYHINKIESKYPRDFQNIKSINSVGFGDDPPDYYLIADVTENRQGWVNYVYHDYCHNSEIIDYLVTKNIWIETIGTISKYIVERNSARMQDIKETFNGVTFDLVSDQDPRLFDVELTVRIYLGNKSIGSIAVDGRETEFIQYMVDDQQYAKFSILPRSKNEIKITGLKVSVPYCGDSERNQRWEECDDGNIINGDGCTSDCKREEIVNIGIAFIRLISDLQNRFNANWQPLIYFFGSP